MITTDNFGASFGQFLSKTENTQQISNWIARNSKSKLEALQHASHIAYHYNQYKSDMETYGVVEKFATPDEVLKRGVGDCDCKSGLVCAILDGLPPELRPDETHVTIGRYMAMFPPNPFEYHAWAEARIGDTWYVLDGTSGEVAPKPDIRYIPMFHMYPDKVTMNNPGVEMLLVAPLIPALTFQTAIRKFTREMNEK